MIEKLYQKILLCAVCAIACNAHVCAMGRATRILGHVPAQAPPPAVHVPPAYVPPQQQVKAPNCSAEYSIAHAKAVRVMSILQDLAKYTDAKKPVFSDIHVYALKLLIGPDFIKDDTRTETDLMNFFRLPMQNYNFASSVYSEVGKILNGYQYGAISGNFLVFLISYAPMAQDMFAHITRCSSERYGQLHACIKVARNNMRDETYSKAIQSRYTSPKHFCDVANECIPLLENAFRISRH